MSVLANLPFDGPLDEADLSWPDEVEDPQVDYSTPLTDTATVVSKVESQAAQGSKRTQSVHPNFSRKPFTRSAKKNAEDYVKQLGKQTRAKRQTNPPSSSKATPSLDFVTHSELGLVKEWIIQQNDILRTNITHDIERLLGLKAEAVGERDTQNPIPSKKDHVEKDVEPESCKKRKRDDVQTISSGSTTPSLKESLTSKAESCHVKGAATPLSRPIDDRWDDYGIAQTIAMEVEDSNQKVCFSFGNMMYMVSCTVSLLS